MFNKLKTKYFMVAYNSTNFGFGNSTQTVIGNNPHLNLQKALNYIQKDGVKNPIILNIMEITQEQHKEFSDWFDNDKND
jgi:hypothetical protein